jgi:hypothetical protein
LTEIEIADLYRQVFVAIGEQIQNRVHAEWRAWLADALDPEAFATMERFLPPPDRR